ncbi:MAG TPA: D-hexose-6-phosphate mutarotase [Pseudomonas sp.]|nr:D-hexose-6-phosphate mutarotase [Pseudomonas sp.]
MAALFEFSACPLFRWDRFQGRDLLLINHPLCQAAFSRQGGQLLHFQPRGQRPWLWCAARWPALGAIRGGVPLCWPWFGRHPQQGGWPHHGWARLSDWQLLRQEADEQGVQLLWCLELCDWRAELHVSLGEQLALRLVTRHADSEACQLSQALHAYWNVSDVSQISLLGLDGARGEDLLLRTAFEQQGELRIVDACHRVLRQAGVLQVHDLAWQRRLHIDSGSGPNCVVWHPGSRPLNAVSWREALGFVSVQVACCGADSVTLAPGDEAVLSLRAWAS